MGRDGSLVLGFKRKGREGVFSACPIGVYFVFEGMIHRYPWGFGWHTHFGRWRRRHCFVEVLESFRYQRSFVDSGVTRPEKQPFL